MDCSYSHIIFMGHVRDETLYFYKWINNRTIIVLLTKPPLQTYDDIFQTFCVSKGCTVINLAEKSCFDEKYELSEKSKNIIDNVLNEYSSSNIKILTHPKYEKSSDPHNRALYDYITEKSPNNHFVFSMTKNKQILSDYQKKILIEYCMIFTDENTRRTQFIKYAQIAEKVGDLK